jgi:hypothetical protein
MLTTFNAVRKGEYFISGGNICLKTSSRTAKLIQYNRVFYFSQNEVVTLKTN